MKNKTASNRLVDREARQKIVEELDKTFFVEAGAGSGKTKSLVDRMISLLRAGRCSIRTIAAVTFTRKAAAELRGRFQVELERKVAEEIKPSVKARLQDGLQNLEQCYIGTIHSFCAKLLRERPIEIGLDPDFVEMEEIEDDVFRDRCWLEYLVRVRLEEAEILRGLDEAGLAPEDLRDAFNAVALYPEVEIVGGKKDIPDYDCFKGEFEKFIERARKVVPKERPEKGYDSLQRLMVRCFIRQKNLGFADHRILMETYEFLDRDPGVIKNRWPSKEVADAFKADFDYFRESVVARALSQWREYRQEKIVRFLKPAIAFFERRRKEENRLNFEDLLLHAARLLRDNPEVRRYFSRKFTHILVDEFQDTDPIQAEVFLYLKGEDLEEKDWQKLRPEPGSLFLVGDPKQSVYRFRRADIDIYNIVKKIVVEAGGEVLRLITNFRSLGVLAEWNNSVFQGAFPEEADKHQAAFAPLETVREDEGGTNCGVFKVTVPKVERNKGELIAGIDAAVLADWIKWACSGNVRLARSEEERQKGLGERAQPSDFLILFRYKKNMDLYARALEERGIPFEITGSDAFAESEEVQEITKLALALIDPENPVYAVAVLRGIFFGVSDQELLDFRREGGKFNFMLPEQDILESKKLGAVVVAVALAKLKEWRGWTLKLPVSAALQRIFEDSGILNYLASLEMGSSRVGNMFKLLEIIRNEERKGVTAFAGLVKFLEELPSVREIEEISLTPGRENAVRLMNLHKAKGLEAPVVFLANPVGVREHEVDKHVVRVEEASPRGYFAFRETSKPGKVRYYHKKFLSQPVGWEQAANEEEKYQQAEEMRLMYVAATRARNVLAISTYSGNLSHKAWEMLDKNLGDVRELELPQQGERKMEREKLELQKGELEKARKTISMSLEAGAEPTYAVETVTAVAKREREAPVRRGETGLGLSWGRLVHQVLEAIGNGRLEVSGKKLELYIENILVAEERYLAEKERLLTHIDSILKSGFWQRVMKAEKRYFEIPFSIKTDKESLGRVGRSKQGSAEGRASKTGLVLGKEPKADLGDDSTTKDADIPVILSGTIDLVFKEDSGWVIADYKTDQIRPEIIEEDIADLVQIYGPQVKLYTRFWEQITGEKVKEAGLYFTSIHKFVNVFQYNI